MKTPRIQLKTSYWARDIDWRQECLSKMQMICTIGVFLLGLDLLVQKPWTSVAGALIMFGLSILFSASYKKHVKETAEKMNKISLEKEDGTKSTT